MKTIKAIIILTVLCWGFGAKAQDLISGGTNSWILHTPDDGRTTMYVAPNTNGTWDWSKQTRFDNNGEVVFSNTISTGGNVVGRDFISGGSNTWIFHTPDDGRTTLYMAPNTNGAWDWSKQTIFSNDGKVHFSNNISINGKIEAKEILLSTTPTADFVFEDNYDLPSLNLVEQYIQEKKHLPEIASANEMKENGVNVADFQIQLLQKIEELTLYTIDQQKEIETLKQENEALKSLNDRLSKIESLLNTDKK